MRRPGIWATSNGKAQIPMERIRNLLIDNHGFQPALNYNCFTLFCVENVREASFSNDYLIVVIVAV